MNGRVYDLAVPRRQFHLLRHHDVHGVSGEGVVADGVRYGDDWVLNFPDGMLMLPAGWCELRWRGENSSTALYQSTDMLLAIHGHDGATELIWQD